MESLTTQSSNKPAASISCTHRRMIDDVVTRGGKRTGRVRCLECGATFDDPYRHLQ